MSEFDPYLKWLGIRDPLRPPHHYRLLGIDVFESDPDIIKGAAKRQIGHVQSYLDSDRGEDAKHLIVRLKKSARILLNDETKTKYDQQLKTWIDKQDSKPAIAPVVPTAIPPAIPVAHPVASPLPAASLPEPSNGPAIVQPSTGLNVKAGAPRKKRNMALLNMIGIIGGGLAAVACAAFIINAGWLGGNSGPDENTNNDNVALNDSGPKPEDPVTGPDPDRFNGAADQPLPEPPADTEREIESNPDSPPATGTGTGFAGMDSNADPISDTGTNTGVFNDNAPPTFNPGDSSLAQSGQPNAFTGFTPDPQYVRAPIPDDADLVDSRKLIKELYPDLYDRSIAPEQKIQLLSELVDDSDQTSEASPAFVLLSESAAIAKSLNEPKLCVNALEKLDERFETDFYELADSSIGSMVRKVETPEQLLQLSEVLTLLALRGIREKEYDFAVSMSSKGTTVAKKINPATLRFAQQLKDDVKEIDRIASKAEKARETLAESIDDKSAHEALGDELCLVLGDFSAGTEHWMKSNDNKLKNIGIKEAEANESSGLDGERYKAAGDAWFEEGKDAQNFRDVRMLARAAYWYRLLLPGQKGLAKEVTSKRIDEIENFLMDTATSGAFAAPVDEAAMRVAQMREWKVDVVGGDSFTAFFRPGNRVRIVRGGRVANLIYVRSGRMFVVSLNPEEDAVLYFSVRPDLDRIDYKKVVNATGVASERGAGRR